MTLKNETKFIINIIKSLGNKGIVLKGITKNFTSQEGRILLEFSNNFVRPLMTAGLPLMRSVLTLIAKSVLIPLKLSAGMSAADAAIQKKNYGSEHPLDLASRTTALITLNEEMEDITKMVKSLESALLIKIISETIKNEAKEQKGGVLPMSFETLPASISGNALTGRRVIKACEEEIRAGEKF